jgi:PAP2 superfamily
MDGVARGGESVVVMSDIDRPSVRDRLAPVGRAWRPLVVGWLVLFAAVTTAGLLLVGPFAGGRVDRWDLDIARWFVDHRTSTWNSLAEAGTWAAETVTVPAVLLLAAVGVLATVIALCRMYTGFHYLSDSIAGVLVGAAWLTIVYRSVLLPSEVTARAQKPSGHENAPRPPVLVAQKPFGSGRDEVAHEA